MYAVRFTDTPGLYGTFATTETAKWWADLECDRRTYTIHRLDPTS